MKNQTPVKEKVQEQEKPTQEKTTDVSTKHESYLAYPFHLLQRDMNQLFENFTRGIDMWRPPFVEPFFGDFQIKLDIKDNDNQIIVNAEIPGVEQKDIEVLLTDETLSIKGEKKEQKEEQDKGYYRAERSYGSFQRMIPLPCAVERDHVDATFKNGILTIVLPKSKKPLNSAKKIEFKNT